MTRHNKKRCTLCKNLKSLSCFYKNKNNKDKLTTRCKNCMKKLVKENYQQNKQRYIDRANNQQLKIRKYVYDYLLKSSCLRCGESNPACLDFDHVDPSTKLESISKTVRKGWSIEKVECEMSKCVILCANCHRKRTAQQQGWYKAFEKNKVLNEVVDG